MIKMDMRFRNGILFVRIIGSINDSSYKDLDDNLTDLIIDNGIRYVVLNLKYVKHIDGYGMGVLFKNYQNILKNNGKLILCGENKMFRDIKLTDTLYQISDESKVMDVINI